MTTQTTLTRDDSAKTATLHIAFELSDSQWLLAMSDGEVRAGKSRVRRMEARDLARLAVEVDKARRHFGLASDCELVSCYEAGRDGFWLHRELEQRGFHNVVVDSASIEVNRRKRRAKTDRLDARRLLSLLLRYQHGETDVWSVVRVPSVDDEDARQLHRERTQLKKEIRQHRMRIQCLLITQGVKISVDQKFLKLLPVIQLPNGGGVPQALQARLRREYERLTAAQHQLREVEKARLELLRRTEPPKRIVKVQALQRLRGVGMESSWLLVMEFFGWRTFNNRREVGAAAGLTGCPFNSGNSSHEQGISKAGNPRVRSLMVELAWLWLRHQPDSELSHWFARKWGAGSTRSKKVGIVALARRLLIALWKYVERGVTPAGALLKN